MKSKNLKKLLAGLGVAGLISAGGISLPGAHATGSGWGANTGAGSTSEAKKPAGSGWGGTKDSAGSTEECKEKDEKTGKCLDEPQKEESPSPKQKPAKSGWSG